MTFTSGQKVLAADYNTLITDLNEVYAVGTGDKGYGATPIPTVSSFPPFLTADKVTSAQWLDMRDATALMGNHQDTVLTLPDASDIETGDPITAFSDLATSIVDVTNARLDVTPSSTVVDKSVLSDQRVNDWSTQIQHIFTVDFTTDDAARHFFNTGGQIRLTMDAPATDEAHQWGAVYAAAGTFIFDHNSYYGLSSTIGNPIDILIFSSGGGVYSFQSNTWSITAKFIAGSSANGARGSKLEISSTSTDNYSGNPSFPGSPDVVVGTFTSTIGERRSVTFFNRPQPIYDTITSLVSGT